jgi:predicted nucleotidyltransferase
VATKEITIRKAINLFVRELSKEIIVKKVILFGSWARGQARPDSDIDIIVVSPAFAKGKYMENMQYLFRKAAKVDSRLEPIPATPKELQKLDERTFLAQAVSSGKVCYSAVKRKSHLPA